MAVLRLCTTHGLTLHLHTRACILALPAKSEKMCIQLALKPLPRRLVTFLLCPFGMKLCCCRTACAAVPDLQLAPTACLSHQGQGRPALLYKLQILSCTTDNPALTHRL